MLVIDAVILIVALIIGLLLQGCNRGLKKEIESLRQELARQQQYVPLDYGKLRDSLSTTTQVVREVEHIKETLSEEDKKLIKELGINVKRLEALQKIGMEAKDTVQLLPVGNATGTGTGDKPAGEATGTVADVEAGGSNQDSIFTYKDAWTDFVFYLNSKKLAYKYRDSLAITMDGIVRKKFLFFKWGVKGYNLKTVNFNPHSEIKHNTFVMKTRKK